MQLQSARSLRLQYLEWVEEQIEEYKETVSRGELMRLADEVVDELRVNPKGQYQLTELLLCAAVDRKIFRLLRLPGYRSWCGTHAVAPPAAAPASDAPADLPDPERAPAPESHARAAEAEAGSMPDPELEPDPSLEPDPLSVPVA